MACRYAFIHEADVLIYIRLLVTGLSGCCTRSSVGCVLCVWESEPPWPQLQTGRPEKKKKNPSCLVVSYASGFLVPPVLCSDWLTHFTQTVGHSPLAKGKCGWKVEGRPVALCHTSAGEVSAGHSRGGLVGLSTICLLPLKNFSTETYAISVAAQCWTLTAILPFKIEQLESF